MPHGSNIKIIPGQPMQMDSLGVNLNLSGLLDLFTRIRALGQAKQQQALAEKQRIALSNIATQLGLGGQRKVLGAPPTDIAGRPVQGPPEPALKTRPVPPETFAMSPVQIFQTLANIQRFKQRKIKEKPISAREKKALFELEQEKKIAELNNQALAFLSNIDKPEFKNDPVFLKSAKEIALSLPKNNIRGQLLRKELGLSLTEKPTEDKQLQFQEKRERRIAGTEKRKIDLKKKELDLKSRKAKEIEKQKIKESKSKRIGDDINKTTLEVIDLVKSGEDIKLIVKTLRERYKNIPNTNAIVEGILKSAGVRVKIK